MLTLRATLRGFSDIVINRCMDIADSLVRLVIGIPIAEITESPQK